MSLIRKTPNWLIDELTNAEEIAGLFTEILTYKTPGQLDIAELFPQEVETWNRIAGRFRTSGVFELQSVGHRMRKLLSAILTLDELARNTTGGNSRAVRRQAAIVSREAKAYLQGLEKLRNLLT